MNRENSINSREEYLSLVEKLLLAANEEGSSLVIFPEYVSEMWLPYCGRNLPELDEVAAMAVEGIFSFLLPLLLLPRLKFDSGAAQIPFLQAIVNKVGVDLMAGSWPVLDATTGAYYNRAFLFVVG